MKLSEVDDKVKKLQVQERNYYKGYQIVDVFNKKLEWPSDPRTRVKTDRWIVDKRNGYLFAASGDIYPLGFHLYIQPINEKCRLIYYRDPVSFGYDDKEFMVVAKQIYITSKV